MYGVKIGSTGWGKATDDLIAIIPVGRVKILDDDEGLITQEKTGL